MNITATKHFNDTSKKNQLHFQEVFASIFSRTNYGQQKGDHHCKFDDFESSRVSRAIQGYKTIQWSYWIKCLRSLNHVVQRLVSLKK